MTDFDLGKVWYNIEQSNQGIYRRKIVEEIDGVEWFRYDRPLWRVVVTKYTIVGRIEPQVTSGEVDTSFVDHDASIFLREDKPTMPQSHVEYEKNMTAPSWTTSIEEAELRAEQMRTEILGSGPPYMPSEVEIVVK